MLRSFVRTWGVLLLVLFGLWVISRFNYLLFHGLAEVFSIVIGFSIFLLAWNSRRFQDNHYLLLVGIALLFVGSLDMVHTMAYKGMDVFPGDLANPPTQLWIASRFMLATTLLVAPFYLRRKADLRWVLGIFIVATTLILLSIFYWKSFPVCFVDAAGPAYGLTSFKKVSELIIAGMFLGAVGLLLRNQDAFEPSVLRWLTFSILANLVAEVAFITYVSVYDISNLTGHMLKILAYYLIYRALLFTGLVQPFDLLFRNLKQQEDVLRQWNAQLEQRVQARTLELVKTNQELQSEIAERRRAEAELQKYREHLEELVKARTADLEREVQERQRAEAAVKRYAADLERSNRDLEDFAYIASHDLQEPLRKIQAFGERLQVHAGERLNEKEQDYLKRMQSAAQRMQAMIKGLLDYSRVGKKALESGPVDLRQVIAGVLSDLELRLERSGGQVQVGDLAEIQGDATQMRQMLLNLIGNALKFHRAGVPPQVKVYCRPLTTDLNGQGTGMVELVVEDNGIGFDTDAAINRLFQPFQRLHARSEYEGSGVGLAVCRKIAERHGGAIRAMGQPEQGATFIVTLPLAEHELAHTGEVI